MLPVIVLVVALSTSLLAVTPAIAATLARTLIEQGEAETVPLESGALILSGSMRTIAALVIVGQSVLILGLLFQAHRRRTAERALRDRQEELQRSQARYTLATAAGAVGVWDWNFETNELFVDAVLKGLLGFEEDEISTRPDDWGSRVHPDDLPKAAAAIKACVDGATDVYEIEHRMLHKDGSVRWMLSRGSVLRSATGSVRRLVGTKVDITEKVQSDEVNRDNELVIGQSHEHIQKLAEQLIASQEVERARFARDLHDDLSQQIAALAIALRGLRIRLARRARPDDIDAEIASLQDRMVGLADNVRRLSHDLHPSVIERIGLVAALQEYCADVQREHPVAVAFTVDGDFSSTPGETALCLYRVVQESMRNVVAHSKAGRAEVHLQRQGDKAFLTVADDGRGFDVVEAGKHHHGLGLVSITERVRLAGGTVSVVSELQTGTRLHVEIPVAAPALAARTA